jgi:transposase
VRESLSDQQAATLYDIRHAGAIGIWRGRYDVGGVGALAPQPKGRRPMPHKYHPAPIPKDMTEDELRKENANLRAELGYLKKLEASIQAEKTEALVKKRKWSKD